MQSNDTTQFIEGVFDDTVEHDGQSNSIPRFALNYDFQPFTRFAIGFGGSYKFGESKDVSTDWDNNMTISNAVSFYIAPTFLVSDTTGIYGKISHNIAKARYYDDYCEGPDQACSDKKFIMGFGYGFGIKSFVTKNLYLLAEIERVNYGRENYRMDEIESYSIDKKTIQNINFRSYS